MSHHTIKEVVGYLLFSKVHIADANTISSPISYGTPAITGFMGAFHAMSRKLALQSELAELSLGGVLIACHDCQPQMYRPATYIDYTFNLSRNPIKKDGKTASIVEEGKCHITMSFVVEVLGEEDLSVEEKQNLISHSHKLIQQQRMAGGSVRSLSSAEPVRFFDEEQIDTLTPMLMPAFVLMDASDDFQEIIDDIRQDNPNATALDALIETCLIRHTPHQKPNQNTEWLSTSHKTGRGWLVPMPVGYQGVSELYDAGTMEHARTPKYPSQYVEPIYSLGKWVYPQRLHNNLTSAFWHYSHNADKSLYLVTQST